MIDTAQLNGTFEAAIGYLRRGMTPLALRCGGKIPTHKWKELQDRQPTEDEVRNYFFPGANVGIVLGQIVRVDVDGKAGEQLWRKMCGDDLPLTVEFTTPSGGRGFLFRVPPGSNIKTTIEKAESIGGHQELRFQAKGSQTVVPPSTSAAGDWRWVRGRGIDDVPVAELPPKIVALMQPKPPPNLAGKRRTFHVKATNSNAYAAAALKAECANLAAAPVGGRNDQLFKSTAALFELVAGGALDAAEVEAALSDAADACGLLAEDEAEVRKTIASGKAAGARNPRTAPERTGNITEPADAAPDETGYPTDNGVPDDLDQAPEPEQDAPEPEAEIADPLCFTDLGNSKRLIADCGSIIRFCHVWGCWFVWDGKRWHIDNTGRIMALAKETIMRLYRVAAAQLKMLAVADSDEAKANAKKVKALLDFAIKSQHVNRLKAMVTLAESEPGIPILPKQLDSDPMRLNTLDGEINLKTGKLEPHNPDHYITKIAPVHFDPDATCPTWEKCLNTWQAGKKDMIDFLRRAVGYSLTAQVVEQCLFFLHGDGCNGKSVFLGVLQRILGDYAIQAVAELLTVKSSETHPTERADLFGVRLAAIIETEDGKRLAEALMKQLTGGDRIRARKMRQDFFEFDPTFKIWFGANHKPQVTGQDHAVWRRIKMVPFVVTISDDEKDDRLKEKLVAEAPGILAWGVRGCLEWQRDGLVEPMEVRAAGDAYKAEQDKVGQFLQECCTRSRDKAVRIKKSELYAEFKAWSEANGEKPMNGTAFGLAIARRGITVDSGKRWYETVALRPQESEGT